MNSVSLKSFLAALAATVCCISAQAQESCLSPTALAATRDGKTLFIACATANQILILDTDKNQTLKRIVVPESPLGLMLSPDEARLFVACAAPQSKVCVVDLAKQKITTTISTGHTAMSPVCSPDGKTLFVCNRFENAVSFIDVAKRKEIARVTVPREPVAADITPDGKLLFVANHIHAGRSDGALVSASVSVIDVAERRVLKEIFLPSGSTLLRGVAVSPDGKFVAVTHLLAHFHLPTTQIERGWINNNALSLIDVGKRELLNTVLLDEIDAGAANPWGVTWTCDGKHICVTHAGTHELSIINAPVLLHKLQALPAIAPKQDGSKNSVSQIRADVPNDLAFLVGLRKRIKLGGNAPRAIAQAGSKIYTANYFSDSLSVIDLAAGTFVSSSISLSPPSKLSLGRQGEINFNDASLCFQGWQSCASCHSSDARVDGMNWDNLNDGIGNPKNVKSLLLAHQTPPSMWLGVRSNAEIAVRAGIKNSLFAAWSEEQATAVDEYLKSLKSVPSPNLIDGKLSKAARRGEKIFFDENIGCADCHKPPLFTDLKFHDVGTCGQFDKPIDKFDTPSLIELWRTAPYLHDGSAAAIRDVLKSKHIEHGATSHLTQRQIDDLAAYLLSL